MKQTPYPSSHFAACSRVLKLAVSLALAVCCTASVAGDKSATKSGLQKRDPLKWPFASDSIWNMPIGSDAVYVPANLSATPGDDKWAPMPLIDDEIIVLEPDAPITPIFMSQAGWTGKNRCDPTGGFLMEAPIPADFVVPNTGKNNSTTFLAADGRTLLQTQPFTRCSTGQRATSLVKFDPVDIYGDGRSGSHGASSLSAFGGSIRLGELRPGGKAPRHVLKIDVYAKAHLYACRNRPACYRWPAYGADSYAVGHYGTAARSAKRGPDANHDDGPSFALRMGALLAIPANRSLASLGLETEPGKMLAWTLQNYGAYIVDDTYGPSFGLAVETGPHGSVRAQFKEDWGYDLEQRVRHDTPWVHDMQRIVTALQVVDNNGPNNIGGGGKPLQPLAPQLIAPPGQHAREHDGHRVQ
jgi:hypothetical protein